MATISRYATHRDIEGEILDNLGYDAGDGDLQKAEAFIKAARAWLIMNPGRATHGGRAGEELTLNVQQVKEMLDDALAWAESYAANDGPGNRRFYDFSEYRS